MYFHVSAKPWNVGDVIHPGNWGNLIRAHSNNSVTLKANTDVAPQHRNFMWEAALEVARRAYAPNAPSRANIVFLCQSKADAVFFRDNYAKGATIYTCDPVDPNAPNHLGDFDIYKVPGPLFDFLHDHSKRYWTQAPVGLPELLWGGSVTVTGAA